jgi:hypothetical protein
MLVELEIPVPLAEATITVDEVLERKRLGGCNNAAFRSGAVWNMEDEEDMLHWVENKTE